MNDPVPVNPKVLRWARDSLHLSLEEVANRMKKKILEIEAWERGEALPTYVQLETLAYDIYKRPIALFFFPEVPEEETIEQSFRTLHNTSYNVSRHGCVICYARRGCYN